MRVTDVSIALTDDSKLKAFATVTLDHCFVVRGLKVIQTADRLFLAMPSRRRPDGTFQDVAHPIDRDTRSQFEAAVIGEYRRVSGTDAGA